MFRLISCLAVLATIMLIAVGAHAETMVRVDQSNLIVNPNHGFAIVHNQVIAQTFTVGLAGTLSQVDLQVWKSPGTTGDDVTLRVLATEADGSPDTSHAPLYETIIPLSSIGESPVSLPDEPPITSAYLEPAELDVVPGDVLAVSLRRVADARPPWVLWGGNGDTYGYGYGYSSPNGSSPWVRFDSADTGFRTYVLIPEPSTFILLGMGAVGLLAYGWRRV